MELVVYCNDERVDGFFFALMTTHSWQKGVSLCVSGICNIEPQCHHMGNLWVPHGYLMGIKWVTCVSHVGTLWTSHTVSCMSPLDMGLIFCLKSLGLLMYSTLLSHGCHMSIIWISHGGTVQGGIMHGITPEIRLFAMNGLQSNRPMHMCHCYECNCMIL